MDKRHRNVPQCVRCRCHGFNRSLKGHKQFCPYLHCTCNKCILVGERQKVVAAHALLTRRMDRERQQCSQGKTMLVYRVPGTPLLK